MTRDLRPILLSDAVVDKLPLAMRQWWPTLAEQILNNPPVLEAFLDWLAHPADQDSQAVFRVKLRSMLQKNPTLMAEFEKMVNTGTGAVATQGGVAAGAGGVAVFGDIHGDVVVGRDQAIEQLERTFGESNVVVRGDSNTIVVNVPEVRPTDLRSAYLRWIFAEHSPILLAGVDPKSASESNSRLDLAAIYVPLLTTSSDTNDSSERRELRWLSAVEQINQNARLILLGDPGSGKSTFLNYVALCLAGEDLGNADINLKALTAPLAEVDQHWEHGPLLPVRVILREFAAHGMSPAGQRATSQNLWQFIANNLRYAAFGDYVPFLRSEFLQVGGLILLDGLDEVPEAEGQRIQLKTAIEDFAVTFPRVRILITSRTSAYAKQAWRLTDFAETTLAPFTQSQIERFVNNWYAQLAEKRKLIPEAAHDYATRLMQGITHSPRLTELAQRPLLLTLMISLHAWRGGALPEKREELYADTVDLLLDQWERPKTVRDSVGVEVFRSPSLSEWIRIERAEVRQLLEELAYEAHASQPEMIGTGDVAEGKLVVGLMNRSRNPDANPARLADYLSQRAGLLLQRAEGVYTFPHRAIQEYLAACYLTEHGYPDVVADLALRDPNRWREVALLAAARAGRGTSAAVWFLVEALCVREPSEQAVAQDYWGALIAAQALVENVSLGAVRVRDALRLNRVRGWLIRILTEGALSPLERAQAGDYLAQLGDPRPAVMKVSQIEFCCVPAGPFVMGGDDSDSRPTHQIELPEYWLARYPVTVAQWQEFVKETGYRPTEPDSLRGIVNHPVTGVTWHEAFEYCRWLNEQLKGQTPPSYVITLPSEAEWEKAARGGTWLPTTPSVSNQRLISPNEYDSRNSPTPQRLYPWGNEFNPEYANTADTNIGATTPVGIFPQGASPYGVLDMSGNVMEWTRSLWGPDRERPQYKYPYKAHDGREDLSAPDDVHRVLRGGAFNTSRRFAECSYRVSYPPYATLNSIGFRVACVCLKL